MIDGKPLVFMFAVENRAPVLNYTPDLTINRGDNARFFALDPDEDELTYYADNEPITGNSFIPETSGTYRISVKDNEGLYDYQDVRIVVRGPG